MTIVEGDCGSVIIREKEDDSQSYPLEICAEGEYYFNRFTSPDNWTGISSDNPPEAFHPLGQTNTVAIVAIDNTFAVYANGKKVDQITDHTYSTGVIGLSADAPTDDTTVVYQDVRIWALP